MDPSAACIARWTSDDAPGTVADLCTWAGVRGALKAALMADIDAEDDDHFRGLAAMPEEVVKGTIDGLMVDGDVGGVAVPKMQAAKLVTLFRAARVAAGVQPTTAEEKAMATAPATTATEVLGTTRAAGTAPDEMDLKGVLVQSGAVVAKKLTPQDLKDA